MDALDGARLPRVAGAREDLLPPFFRPGDDPLRELPLVDGLRLRLRR